ncbi:IS3 family transposase, partial [Bifidobacterium breve]
ATLAYNNLTKHMLREELVCRNHYAAIGQLRHDPADYVWWSDNRRLRSTLGYRSPKEFTEQGLIL